MYTIDGIIFKKRDEPELRVSPGMYTAYADKSCMPFEWEQPYSGILRRGGTRPRTVASADWHFQKRVVPLVKAVIAMVGKISSCPAIAPTMTKHHVEERLITIIYRSDRAGKEGTVYVDGQLGGVTIDICDGDDVRMEIKTSIGSTFGRANVTMRGSLSDPEALVRKGYNRICRKFDQRQKDGRYRRHHSEAVLSEGVCTEVGREAGSPD